MLLDKIWEKNYNSQTSLASPINESQIFDLLSNATQPERILGLVLIMLILLKKRFDSTEEKIRNDDMQEKESGIFEDKLAIGKILRNLIEVYEGDPLLNYICELINLIVERHLLESAIRLAWGTKNWIFTEEEGRLNPARPDLVYFYARDNRWDSILHLLRDTGFIVENDPIKLTKKGFQWLKLIG